MAERSGARVVFGGERPTVEAIVALAEGSAPHVIGALVDALPRVRAFLETELSSANDNPLVCNETMSHGLPANLILQNGPQGSVRHDSKAMPLGASALAAEALKLTMPASVFSRSTECHNQDKVSMGTIAARDCLRILELTETAAAIGVLVMCQGVDLRRGEGCHRRSQAIHAAMRGSIPVVDADRRTDHDIAAVLRALRSDDLPIGEVEAS